MSEDIAVTISRDPEQFGEDHSFFMKPDEMNSTSNTREYLKFHCFARRSNYTAMNFEVKPHNLGIYFNVITNFNLSVIHAYIIKNTFLLETKARISR